MDIKALKADWFFDDITPRGLSFDAFLPQACKTPLGNMKDFELIHSPKKMAEFLGNPWYDTNPGLAEILMTVSPLESDKHVLVDKYRQETADILNLPCDIHEHDDDRPLARGACRGFKTLQKDLSRYGDAVITGDNEFDEGKLYDVKKEIYRLTDRVVSGLAKCFHVQANGAFEIIDQLLGKGIISSAARDNLASASAIGLKLRVSTYLKAGKQGEELKAKHTDTSDETVSSYHMPQDEELFQFFYVAIPLYEKLFHLFFQDKDFKTLSQDVFFDCRDAVKASIYSRILNYTKAVECYEHGLKTNPDDVNMEIRQLRLLLIINDNTESTRHKLDCLLEKIFDVPHSKWSEDTPSDVQLDNILASIQAAELRQLLEILMFLSCLQPLNWHFRLAEKLFDRCLCMESTNNSSQSHLLMMDFAFSNFYVDKISNWQGFDAGMSKLSLLVDNEGVSTKSTTCLNKLAEFFYMQGKYDKSYQCLQRALTMERTLYGTNPNVNVLKTLHQLGMVSMQLFKFVEGQFYLEQLLQQFDSFHGPRPRLIHKQACLQLAILYSGTDRCEEAVSLLKKGLALTTDRKHAIDIEQNFDCIIHCEMAKLLRSLDNHDEAKECVQNAKDYLSGIALTTRVAISCYVAMTLHELGLSDEGILLLNEEIQQLDVQSHPENTGPCLVALGKICYQKRRTVEAETHHCKALEIFSAYPNNSTPNDVLECLLEVSDILTGNGKPLEGRKKLEDARQYLSSLNDKHAKCNMLKEVGERWERFGEIHLAATCYDEALQLCNDTTLETNIPLTEFSLELKLGDLCGKGNVGKKAKEYESYVTKEQRVAAQRNHFDRAGSLLQQYSTRRNFDTLLIELFLLLASKYARIDLSEMEKHLLRALEISNILCGSVIDNDMISTVLFHLFQCYFSKGECTSALDVIERSLRLEMDQHSLDSFHPHICHRVVFFSVLLSLTSPTTKDTGELLVELFQKGLNDERFTCSTVTVKANAAHCFTFLSLIFWRYRDYEQAQLFNNIALELFEEIKEEGIPESRSSSQIVCSKIKNVLEQPNNPQAVVALLQFLSLATNYENDIWAFLDEYNTRDKLKNIFDLVLPSYFKAKGVDMSSFLPQFISLYDQYSDHIDPDSAPYLPYSMELLRGLSRELYGENPSLHGQTLSLDNLVDLLPSAKNVVSSLFSSGNGTSFVDQAQERVARTNFGAVSDHSVEDILTNALNTVSSLFANARSDNRSSVLGSLLSFMDQSKGENDCGTVPSLIQRKISIDSVQEDKDSDSKPASVNDKNCAEPVKQDGDVVIPPSIQDKVGIDTVEKDKDSDSVFAPNNGKKYVEHLKDANESGSTCSLNYGKAVSVVSVDPVEEGDDKNCSMVTQPVLERNADVNSSKKADNDSLNPSFFAMEALKCVFAPFLGKEASTEVNGSPCPTSQSMGIFRNVVAKVFEKDTDLKVSLKNSDNSPPFSVEVQENKDKVSSSRQDKVPRRERLSQAETVVDNPCQEYQSSHSTNFQAIHSSPPMNNLETTETSLCNLEDLKQKLEAMRTLIPVIQKLADCSKKFLEKGELQKYLEVHDNLIPLIKSLVEIVPADTAIEKCLTNATKELENNKANSALSSLSLATQFPRSDRQDARIVKMSGDCHLLEANYRLAVINFTRAADYYSRDKSQEPGDIFAYLETLVSLIKAHILCQNLQDALLVCQDGVAAVSQLETNEITSLRTMEFCYLSAKCIQLSKITGDDLEKAASFCQQGLAASKVVDGKTSSSDLMESLGKNGKIFTLKCETQLLHATILLQLNRKEEAEATLTSMQSFLVNVAVGFETFTATTWELGKLEFSKISCRLFTSIGRAFVMNSQAKSAIGWLAKSLSAFIAAMDILPLNEEFTLLLDATTAANADLFPDENDSFQTTVDMCKREILEANGDVYTIYQFMFSLGYLYMETQRINEAIVVYKTALAAAECMSGSLEDQHKRAFIQLHLGHAHRLRVNNNTDEDSIGERVLARKYYETEDKDLHGSTLCRKLSLAFWLVEENEFAEANVLLQELLEPGDKLANIPVVFGYFSRLFYGPLMKEYVEQHGECTTTLACVVYSLAVFVYAGLGMTSKAVLACEKLSTQRDLVRPMSTLQPSLTSYLLAACQRKLSFLVNDQNVENCDFPLSPINLAKLYYELMEYELVLKCCSEILESVMSPSSELEPSDSNYLKLACLRIVGNTIIQLGNHDKCYSYFISFLEVLHSQMRILDLEFEAQCAVLDEYSFADRFYIMRLLGTLHAKRGNPDCAIKCYEKCFEDEENLESHQGLVGTLAELYQSKAQLAKEEKTAYTHWMKLARDLYERLFQKTTKLDQFVESSYGSFLCMSDRSREAIDYFLHVIEAPEDITVSFADEDKPLLDAHLAREIEVRTSISLPLNVFTYHQLCTAYVKTNEMEKAQESAVALEKYVCHLQSNSDYPLLLSVVGYTYKLIGNTKKAINVFVSVLEKMPGHPPVTEALESYFLDLD